MKRGLYQGWMLAMTATLLSPLALAEQVVFVNGDTLTVSIQSIKSDTVFAKSSLLGEMKIPMKQLKSIVLQGSYWIRTKGSDSFSYISIKPGEKRYSPTANHPGVAFDDFKQLAELSLTQPQTTALAEKPAALKKAKLSVPIDAPPIPHIQTSSVITADSLKKVARQDWLFSNQLTGYLSFDDLGSKDKRTMTFSGSGKSQARNTSNRNTLSWSLENKKENDGTHNEKYNLGYDYNYFLNAKQYLLLSGDFTRSDSDSPYKIIRINSGLGYQVFDTDVLSLNVEVGPGYAMQYYHEDENVFSPAAFVGLHYRQKLTDELTLFNDTNVYYILKNQSTLVKGILGAKHNLTSSVWLELVHQYTWNSNPEPEYNRLNGGLKFGVGFAW